MGTGSDTRIYAPRSESSHMFRNNHEEDTYGLESQKVRDAKMDKKIREKEETRDKLNNVKHVKVKPSDIQQFMQEDQEETDDSEKIDADRELSAQTGPAGNLGALTSLASQARGPGFAGGHAFAMGEAMNVLDRILKIDPAEEDIGPRPYGDMSHKELYDAIADRGAISPFRRDDVFSHGSDEERELFLMIDEMERRKMDEAEVGYSLEEPNDDVPRGRFTDNEGGEQMDLSAVDYNKYGVPKGPDYGQAGIPLGPQAGLPSSPQGNPFDNYIPWYNRTPDMPKPPVKVRAVAEDFSDRWKDKNAAEPMDIGVLLLKRERERKSSKDKKKEKRRKAEKRKKWRPSTGKFSYGPGGTLGPKGATNRRNKARMRSVKRGRLTGMMDAPKAVEMEHRGVAIKQPKSKDPGPYKEFLGQQESRRRMGNVRSPTSSQMRYGARKYYSGKTGGGRLQGMGDLKVKRPRLHPVRMPKIQPPAGLATPHLLKPQMTGAGGMGGMPSASPPMMSGTDEPSMVMTSKVGVGSNLQKAKFGYYEITELRQLINQAKRALSRKEKKKKSTGNAESVRSKQTPTGQTTKPQGGTENAEAENIGGVVGVKGGRTA